MQKSILLLDDDIAVTELISRVLKKNDLNVISYNELDDAKEDLLKNKYDLIISDIILGEGITCDDLILDLSNNEDHVNNDTDIIIISRFVNDVQAANLISNIPNVVQVYKKPFDRNSFSDDILSLVNTDTKESFTGFDFEDLVNTLSNEILTEANVDNESVSSDQNVSNDSSDDTGAEDVENFTHPSFSLDSLSDIDERNKNGQTWIMQLASAGDMENVKKIIYRGGNLKLKCKLGKTALHYASRSGNPELVEYLLDRGLKHTMSDIKGEDPLYDAIKSKQSENVKVLIEYGARIERQVNGQSYLIFSILNDDLNTLKVLLSAGADPRKKDQNGNDAITVASKNEKSEMLKLLKAFLAKK